VRGSLEGTCPSRALDRDLGMEDPGQVGTCGKEDEEDRQDEGQLDDRLAA